jgi:hypothetical protein
VGGNNWNKITVDPVARALKEWQSVTSAFARKSDIQYWTFN